MYEEKYIGKQEQNVSAMLLAEWTLQLTNTMTIMTEIVYVYFS